MKRILIVPLLLLSMPVLAGNYAACVLDKLEGAQNSYVVGTAHRLCLADHPGGLPSVEQGSGRGWFAKYDSSDQCLYENAKTVLSSPTASMIKRACTRLYDAPNYFDRFDPPG